MKKNNDSVIIDPLTSQVDEVMNSLSKMSGVKAYKKDDIPDYLMVRRQAGHLETVIKYAKSPGLSEMLQIKDNPYILDIVLVSEPKKRIQRVCFFFLLPQVLMPRGT